MAGASPHRSRQNMQRTKLAGAILIQHVSKSGFDPTYELLARQRQTEIWPKQAPLATGLCPAPAGGYPKKPTNPPPAPSPITSVT